YLETHPADDGTTLPADLDGQRWTTIADLLQTRIVVLSDAWDLIRFLVVDESAFTVDPQSAAKNLTAESREVVDAAIAALEAVEEWTTERIEQALSGALVDGMGIKPRKAYGPVRVAVTGSHISPPLFESLELLGRQTALARLRAAPIAERPADLLSPLGALIVSSRSPRQGRTSECSGLWCNWQHSGFWYRRSRFESW